MKERVCETCLSVDPGLCRLQVWLDKTLPLCVCQLAGTVTLTLPYFPFPLFYRPFLCAGFTTCSQKWPRRRRRRKEELYHKLTDWELKSLKGYCKNISYIQYDYIYMTLGTWVGCCDAIWPNPKCYVTLLRCDQTAKLCYTTGNFNYSGGTGTKTSLHL